MFGASRSQIAMYAAIAAVLLLVGFNSLKGGGDSGETRAFGSGADAGAGASGEGGSDGFELSADHTRLVIDVSGGVRRPGVYRFEEGARVIDAISRAGGLSRAAVPGAINRAAKLADGQQVVVPVRATAGGAGAVAVAAGAGGAEAPISLGTATAEQLEEIEGIGPVTASQIIEFRDSKGGLGSIDELDEVSGIGPVTMEALRSRLQP